MRKYIFLMLPILIMGCESPGQKLEKKLVESEVWLTRYKTLSETYPEENYELSVFSKAAIMEGNPSFAEGKYMGAYEAMYGHHMFGPEPLFQIFLINIDKYNKEADIEVAKRYLEELNDKWKNHSQTLRANALFSNLDKGL